HDLQVFGLRQGTVGADDRVDAVFVQRLAADVVDAKPAVLRVAVVVFAQLIVTHGHVVAQTRLRVEAVAGTGCTFVPLVPGGGNDGRAVGFEARDVGDVDLALDILAGVQRVDPHGQAGLVVDLDLPVPIKHAELA